MLQSHTIAYVDVAQLRKTKVPWYERHVNPWKVGTTGIPRMPTELGFGTQTPLHAGEPQPLHGYNICTLQEELPILGQSMPVPFCAHN